jgi:hypothetical protein
MLNQENHTIPTAAEDTLLAKVLLEVARIESRAADATTSSRRRFASDELCTRRRTSSTAHISRPARSQRSRLESPSSRGSRLSICGRNSGAGREHSKVVRIEEGAILVPVAVSMAVVFAVIFAVLEIASIGSAAVWAFVQVNEALAWSVLDCQDLLCRVVYHDGIAAASTCVSVEGESRRRHDGLQYDVAILVVGVWDQ